MSDQSRAQEQHEILKWAEGLIYVGIMCHKWVHIIGSTMVQILLRNIDGEMF